MYFSYGLFRSAEILRNQILFLGLDSYILSFFASHTHLDLYVIGMTALLKLEITEFSLWFSLPVIQGRSREFIIRNRSVWPALYLLNVSIAFKGIHFYIFIAYQSLMAMTINQGYEAWHTVCNNFLSMLSTFLSTLPRF